MANVVGMISPPPVLDAASFAAIAAEMTQEDELREALIKRSRDVLKLSKNAIYALHRGDVQRAGGMVHEAKEQAKRELLPTAVAHPTLRYGALGSALEEWAEAAIFQEFLATGRIASLAELEIANREEYLGGLMDFTGELGRYAVLRATARDREAVARAREAADQIHAQLITFDFRNGNLRRKYDAVKYTLKKLEQIVYELTLASMATGFVPKGAAEEGPAPGGEGEGEEEEEGGGGAGGGGGPPHLGRGGRGAKRGRTERGGGRA